MSNQIATATIYANQAKDAAEWLREYMHAAERGENGNNPWGEGLQELPGYDEAATAALDPSYRSDVSAFADGSILRSPFDGPWSIEVDGEEVAIEHN